LFRKDRVPESVLRWLRTFTLLGVVALQGFLPRCRFPLLPEDNPRRFDGSRALPGTPVGFSTFQLALESVSRLRVRRGFGLATESVVPPLLGFVSAAGTVKYLRTDCGRELHPVPF
jgi:hypothetical protein